MKSSLGFVKYFRIFQPGLQHRGHQLEVRVRDQLVDPLLLTLPVMTDSSQTDLEMISEVLGVSYGALT